MVFVFEDEDHVAVLGFGGGEDGDVGGFVFEFLEIGLLLPFLELEHYAIIMYDKNYT